MSDQNPNKARSEHSHKKLERGSEGSDFHSPLLDTYWRSHDVLSGKQRYLKSADDSRELAKLGTIGNLELEPGKDSARSLPSKVPHAETFTITEELKGLSSPNKGEGYYQTLQRAGRHLLGRNLSHKEVMSLVSASIALQRERGKNTRIITSADIVLPENERELAVFVNKIGSGKRVQMDYKTLTEFKKDISEAFHKKSKENPSSDNDGGIHPKSEQGKGTELPQSDKESRSRPEDESKQSTEDRTSPHSGGGIVPEGGSEHMAARFDSVSYKGQLNQMLSGTMVVNGHTYRFKTGGQGRGNIPAGEYTVTASNWTRATSGAINNISGVGYTFGLSDKYDPRVAAFKALDPQNPSAGYNRTALQIHPDGGRPGTHGCIGIEGDASTQRRFRQDMAAEFARRGRSFTIKFGN